MTSITTILSLFVVYCVVGVTSIPYNHSKSNGNSSIGHDVNHEHTIVSIVQQQGQLKALDSKHYDGFVNYVKKFKKAYQNDEEISQRFKNYIASMKSIPQLKAKNPHAQFGETKFSDLSSQEFLQKYTGNPKRGDNWWDDFEPDNNNKDELYIDPSNSTDDNEYDWRDHNAVTPVKDQGQCGSCYAFASVAAVESCTAIHGGKLMDLSVQEIVSCTDDYGNQGCNGGYPDKTMDYIVKNGVTSWKEYEYVESAPPCEKSHKPRAHIGDEKTLKRNDEENMKRVVRNIGPVVNAVDGSPMQQYQGGVMSDSGFMANHAVLTVGYGGDNPPYWIIKNSWGEDYGEEGYIRVERNVNACQIAADNYVPIH